MARPMDDAGVAAVIGAIVVLAVLGIGLVYVNAYHVPRQGASMELDAAERASASLTDLAATLAAEPNGPLAHEVPLLVERGTPPLMSGIVLSPLRAGGTLALDASGSSLAVSVVVPAPASGVPANDPVREATGAGLMRVHLLGSETARQPMGTLRATTGGAYAANGTHVLEGGAVLADTSSGSASVSPPAIALAGDALAWRIPLLAGPSTEVAGVSGAQVGLAPGPEAALGGGSRVREVRIEVETPRLAAWQAALEDAIGARGTVVATTMGADAGIITATIADVDLRLFVVRYEAQIA